MTTSQKVLKQKALKQEAGEYAVRFVESGMIVGLGHGSTAIYAIRKLAALLAAGELHDVLGIPCSRQVEEDARALGVPLTTLNDHPAIDLTIDGADEVDPACDVIKGGGGALLREKMVAQATRREIIVVDETKLSDTLGVQWAVPVEVVPFGWQTQIAYLISLGAEVTVRMGADDAAPLDAALRFRGVGSLRVVDASVMPKITSGNTNSPTIMIAEKAADLILSDARG